MEKNKSLFFNRIKRSTYIVLIAVSLLLLYFAIPAKAEEIAGGDFGSGLRWSLDEEGVLMISGNGKMPSFSSASAVPWGGYRDQIITVQIGDGITSIGNNAFLGCSNITGHLMLPDSIIEIGTSAFNGCSRLTDITFPDGLTSLGSYAFNNCSGLTSITLPNGLTNIETGTFYNCKNLTNITFPDGLTSIGTYAFYICKNLTDITFPDSLTSIGEVSFGGCSSLTNVVLPNSITSIEIGAFSECISLTEITLPAGLTRVENSTFAYCQNLAEITLPSSITSIGEYAFENCSSLIDIMLPDSITVIETCAFESCINLKTVSLPGQLKTLGERSFWMCSGLTSIFIPATIDKIGDNAFLDCINLEDIYFAGPEERWEELSQNAGFGMVDLFANYEQDDGLTVNITVTDASGGKLVRMEAPEGCSIYYSLDGSTPCSASLPYLDEFQIDTKGSYIIKAVAINPGGNSIAKISAYNLVIEQSAIPQMEAVGNHVYILPSENVLYSLDLEGEPDTTYSTPLDWDGNLFVKAQVVETGKAKSEIVGCYFQKTLSGYVYRKDSYSFINEERSFGYPLGSYRIPESQMVSLFGFHAARLLLDDMAEAGVSIGTWGGSCFGMCVTSLMFSRGNLPLSNYSETPTSVYSLPAPGSPDSLLTRLIERYQISQFAHAIDEERNDHYTENGVNDRADIETLLNTLNNIFHGDDPDAAVLILYGSSDNSHAVVPYRLEQDSNGNSLIFIYDPDFPDQAEGENVVRIEQRTTSSGKIWYDFEYQNPGHVKYDRAISFNRLATILDKIDSVRSYDAYGILFDTPQEGSMLLSLNTEYFQILDEAGNEVSEYALLNVMNKILPGKTILSLPEGTYTIRNLDTSKERLSVGVADTREYYRAEIGDASASMKIGFQYGHLCMEVIVDDNTDMMFHLYNENAEKSTIEVNTSYFKIYASEDQTIIVESSEPSVTVNGQIIDLHQKIENEIYTGAVIKRKKEKAPEAYDQGSIIMTADIDQILEQMYSLNVEVKNAGENTVVYAACYDEQGQMISLKYADIQAGKTKYPFMIENSPSMVKVFLLEKTGGKPLLESIVIR